MSTARLWDESSIGETSLVMTHMSVWLLISRDLSRSQELRVNLMEVVTSTIGRIIIDDDGVNRAKSEWNVVFSSSSSVIQATTSASKK